MAKLNKSASTRALLRSDPAATTNPEGGLAFTIEPLTRLYLRAASCLFGEKKFYQEVAEKDGKMTLVPNQDQELINDLQAVAKTDPEFILQVALFARSTLHLRTIPIVMLVEASLIPECKPYVKRYTPFIVQRVDELAEAVAYLQARIGHLGNKAAKGSMPASLKKGLALAFHNFNEEQFAKYDREGMVKLRDVVRLVHPIPTNKTESALFKRILERTLKTPETWEVVISTKGSTKENWEAIAPKMGYMAKIRNLRNLLEKGVSVDVLKEVADHLSNPTAVANSKQLPFRYLSAYREVENLDSRHATRLLDALESAMDTSVSNLTKLPGVNFIASDNSGSMYTELSARSTVMRADVANTLAGLLHAMSNDAIVGVFGDSFRTVSLSQRNGVLNNTKEMGRVGKTVGSSTNGWLVMQWLLNTKTKVDRIIFVTDMVLYDSSPNGYPSWSSVRLGAENAHSVAELLHKYRSTINPNVRAYFIDTAGYGTAQTPPGDKLSLLIGGWSDRILEYISLTEKNATTMVTEVKETSRTLMEAKTQPKEERKHGKAKEGMEKRMDGSRGRHASAKRTR